MAETVLFTDWIETPHAKWRVKTVINNNPYESRNFAVIVGRGPSGKADWKCRYFYYRDSALGAHLACVRYALEHRRDFNIPSYTL